MTTTATQQRTCRTCGEPEMTGLADSGEFGWWDDQDGKTTCQRCGSDPAKGPRHRYAPTREGKCDTCGRARRSH